MSVTIEQDLKEYLDKFEQKLDKLQDDVTGIKISLTCLEGRFDTLDEKVDGLVKRIDNQEFVSRGILVALVVSILGGFAKLFGIVGNS